MRRSPDPLDWISVNSLAPNNQQITAEEVGLAPNGHSAVSVKRG